MNNKQLDNQLENVVLGHSQKFLTFALSNEKYGISILEVFEIFGMKPYTRVPGTPDFIKGVINLRGRIVPVVDLRTKFGIPAKAYDEKTCIIVVNINFRNQEIVIGLIVDTVLEVHSFAADMIASTPEYGTSLDSSFIVGMGKYDDGNTTILLDVNRIFNSAEIETIAEAVGRQAEP